MACVGRRPGLQEQWVPSSVCLSAAEISKHPQEWYSAASSHRSQPHDQSADGRLVGTAIPTIGHPAQRGTTEHGCGMASKSAGHDVDRGTQSTPPSRQPGIGPGKMMCAQFQLQRNASIPIIRPVQSVPDDVDSSKTPLLSTFVPNNALSESSKASDDRPPSSVALWLYLHRAGQRASHRLPQRSMYQKLLTARALCRIRTSSIARRPRPRCSATLCRAVVKLHSSQAETSRRR
jgi:hypothetical protein